MSADIPQCDIAVLGAGPAGSAAAIGLARRGWNVRLISAARRGGIEGASARTAATVAGLHLDQIGRLFRDTVPGVVFWGASKPTHREEFLVERASLDRALHLDALGAGVQFEQERVLTVTQNDRGWLIATSRGFTQSSAVVDARGRNLQGAMRRGPTLVALRQTFVGVRGRPCTLVVQGDDAWFWLAVTHDGTGQLIAVCDPRAARSNRLTATGQFDTARLPAAILDLIADATPQDRASACAATATYSNPTIAEGYLRHGDAALAMDPLSGNGMFEALSSTPIAVAAIDTWLHSGDWKAVQQFVDERATAIWNKKVAVAADLYAHAAATCEAAYRPFWMETSRAYRRAALVEPPASDAELRIVMRPVVNEHRIEQRPVLVGPRWPRGIWRCGTLDIAQVVTAALEPGVDPTRLADSLELSAAETTRIVQWIRAHASQLEFQLHGLPNAMGMGSPRWLMSAK